LITDDGIIGRSHLPLPTLINWDYSYWDSNHQEDNMSVEVIATTGEGVGALAVLLTIGYPAFQISQNTAQQKREETVSIQRGQKRSCSQLNEHQMVRRYAMTAEQGRPAGSREGAQLGAR
jgi:hypothetical protein